MRGRERLTSLRTLLSQLFRKYLKALVDLYKREDSPESGLVFYLWIQLGVNMQGRDQDNGELTLSDDLSESIIGDFDEAALDDIEKTHQHSPMRLG